MAMNYNPTNVRMVEVSPECLTLMLSGPRIPMDALARRRNHRRGRAIRALVRGQQIPKNLHSRAASVFSAVASGRRDPDGTCIV